MSCKKDILKNFVNSQENTRARVSFLIKLQLRPATLLKKRLWYTCFPMNFAKFLRTPFFYRTSLVAASTEPDLGHICQHSTKPKLRFCAGLNLVCSVLEIRNGEDLWQWSRLEIRVNAFRQLTIPQKQFIIIIIKVIFCWQIFRGVYRPQSNIYDGAFLLKSLRPNAFNNICK